MTKLVFLSLGLFAISGVAQQPDQPPPAVPASQPAQPQAVVPQTQTPPPKDPAIIEDGGFQFEPIYWFNEKQPELRGGKSATTDGDIDYYGHAKRALGGEIGIPAGRANTLRISYFRVQGNTNGIAPAALDVFGEAYSAGDYLTANYLLQVAKISWDYLSYTWHKPSAEIRVKTLYELQYVNIGTNTLAPLVPITTDASGNTDTNSSSGSANLILPTLGMGLESALGRHFRWEVKASGFIIPHHGEIYDAQAEIAWRAGPVKVVGGERAFHFKTSPQADQYFTDTLGGEYVGVRYYWGQQK